MPNYSLFGEFQIVGIDTEQIDTEFTISIIRQKPELNFTVFGE